jgi:hypothetical protein
LQWQHLATIAQILSREGMAQPVGMHVLHAGAIADTPWQPMKDIDLHRLEIIVYTFQLSTGLAF